MSGAAGPGASDGCSAARKNRASPEDSIDGAKVSSFPDRVRGSPIAGQRGGIRAAELVVRRRKLAGCDWRDGARHGRRERPTGMFLPPQPSPVAETHGFPRHAPPDPVPCDLDSHLSAEHVATATVLADLAEVDAGRLRPAVTIDALVLRSKSGHVEACGVPAHDVARSARPVPGRPAVAGGRTAQTDRRAAPRAANDHRRRPMNFWRRPRTGRKMRSGCSSPSDAPGWTCPSRERAIPSGAGE